MSQYYYDVVKLLVGISWKKQQENLGHIDDSFQEKV